MLQKRPGAASSLLLQRCRAVPPDSAVQDRVAATAPATLPCPGLSWAALLIKALPGLILLADTPRSPDALGAASVGVQQ